MMARAGFEFFCGSALWGLFPMPRTPCRRVLVEPGLAARLGLLRRRGRLLHPRNRQGPAACRRHGCGGPDGSFPCDICRMEAPVRAAGIHDYHGCQPDSEYRKRQCYVGPRRCCPDGNADADQKEDLQMVDECHPADLLEASESHLGSTGVCHDRGRCGFFGWYFHLDNIILLYIASVNTHVRRSHAWGSRDRTVRKGFKKGSF